MNVATSSAYSDAPECQSRDLIANAFLRSGYATWSFVEFEVEGDRIVLRGRVPSYHLKQVAQTLVQRVPGVSRVDNRLIVQRHNESFCSSSVERHDAIADRRLSR